MWIGYAILFIFLGDLLYQLTTFPKTTTKTTQAYIGLVLFSLVGAASFFILINIFSWILIPMLYPPILIGLLIGRRWWQKQLKAE